MENGAFGFFKRGSGYKRDSEVISPLQEWRTFLMEHFHVLSMGVVSLRPQRWKREKKKEASKCMCMPSALQIYFIVLQKFPYRLAFLFPGWLLLFPLKKKRKPLKLRESGKLILGHK